MEVVLPFKCSYCNEYFCAEHRLPENHACPEYWRVKAPREETPSIIVREKPTKPTYKCTTELEHLALGALLVMGVGLSFILQFAYRLEILMILAIVFTLSFLLHELAHKISAQHFGLWAEFRLTMQGAFITLISMLIPIKLISPGAVMIAGPITKESAGKTGLAGPLTNIILSTVCTIIALTTQIIFLWFIAWINAFMAFFNLIPFSVMDGLKVFGWNKMVWALAFGASLPLMVLTFLASS
jgi:Zn-dependent protease